MLQHVISQHWHYVDTTLWQPGHNGKLHTYTQWPQHWHNIAGFVLHIQLSVCMSVSVRCCLFHIVYVYIWGLCDECICSLRISVSTEFSHQATGFLTHWYCQFCTGKSDTLHLLVTLEHAIVRQNWFIIGTIPNLPIQSYITW